MSMIDNNVFVVIDEFGRIYGIYSEFEDAFDRSGELSAESIEVDVEQYLVDQDVDVFDGPDGDEFVEQVA